MIRYIVEFRTPLPGERYFTAHKRPRILTKKVTSPQWIGGHCRCVIVSEDLSASDWLSVGEVEIELWEKHWKVMRLASEGLLGSVRVSDDGQSFFDRDAVLAFRAAGDGVKVELSVEGSTEVGT